MNGPKVPRIALRQERRAVIRRRTRLGDRISDGITDFAGSLTFVNLHVIWFTLWIVANVTFWRFDPFPFGLLTLIVSLEAIFLSTFVLISQNRESARSERRSEIDFETNVLSKCGWKPWPTSSASTWTRCTPPPRTGSRRPRRSPTRTAVATPRLRRRAAHCSPRP
jgi:hypothetical protein